MASAQRQRPENGYTWFPSLAYWMKVPSSSHLRKQGGFLCCHWAYLYAGTCHGVLELSGWWGGAGGSPRGDCELQGTGLLSTYVSYSQRPAHGGASGHRWAGGELRYRAGLTGSAGTGSP